MVVMTDTVLMALGRQDGFTLWAVASYGLAAAGVIALLHRVPVAAFVAAIALASLVGAAYVLLLWVAYHTGRAIMSRSAVVVVIGATIGGLSAQLLIQAGELRAIPNLLSSYVIFVALPLLTGRYLAQHQRMLSTLDQHNRQLRWQRDILAEQERLRERLRIARDMHDSLGHRLSLVSVQAAALEVSTVPEPQKQAIRQLADTTATPWTSCTNSSGRCAERLPRRGAIPESRPLALWSRTFMPPGYWWRSRSGDGRGS